MEHKLIVGIVGSEEHRTALTNQLDELAAEGYEVLQFEVQNSTMYVLLVTGLC